MERPVTMRYVVEENRRKILQEQEQQKQSKTNVAMTPKSQIGAKGDMIPSN